MPLKSRRRTVPYPPTLSPTFCDPDPGIPGHRFVLGKLSASAGRVNPLVVLGMNPSHADMTESDDTVNRVAHSSVELGYSGWTMLNVYPERATRPAELMPFDKELSDLNCVAIERFLTTNRVREVFGAWGNPPNATIRQARPEALAVLADLGVRIFYFGTLTKKKHPRHLRPRGSALDLTATKSYL